MPDRAVPRLRELLLIEDNPGDIRLIQECLGAGEPPHRLAVAANGVEALDYLHRRGAHAATTRPDLILLDWNLLLKDGREVLAEIKRDAVLRRIPVVVLTSSEAESDIETAYDLQANAFVTKPIDFEQFARTIAAIATFWFKVAKLPRR